MNRSAPSIPLAPLWPKLPEPPAPSAPATGKPARAGRRTPPTEAQCVSWWDRFGMPEHIREHSRKVALVAVQLAEAARARGLGLCIDTVRASALLHDLAKIYCVRHGGNHSQLGGAWVMALTGDPLIAQGVIHHVYWPFEVDLRRFFTPLAVLYGDKRVAHDRIVPIESRFGDLVERYGKTEEIRERIHSTNRQAKDIETALSQLLEVDLNAHDFDRGRLVD